MPRPSSLRASDADRDAVAERLRQAAVEGRLDADELEQRLHTALRARTYGDLDRLLRDLPAKPVKWERQRRTAVGPAAGFALVMVARTIVALAVLAVVGVVAVITAAWWMVGLVVFLVLRSQRSCRRQTAWHRPPHVRRV
jgi:Flp pilus assembly protein TadB